jgi:hypothetical protein
MKKLIAMVLLVSMATAANASAFCDGFALGYKTAKGNNNVFVPFCPFEPFTPNGSSPFQEGLKAGAAAAYRK